jgi:magnesium-transporting ATPase (P-type)
VQLLGFFSNPLVIILLIAGVISAALGDLFNASIIATIVLLSVALNFVQSSRSLKAAEALRETVAPTATVLRDAVWKPHRFAPPMWESLWRPLWMWHAMRRTPSCSNAVSGYSTPVTIPTDNVDASFIQKPRKWEISFVRDFMVSIGSISSLYDFVTFGALLFLFRASESLFHTGWFVESLATQTLVVFVIRTVGNPLRSRPSDALAIATLLVISLGPSIPHDERKRPAGHRAVS